MNTEQIEREAETIASTFPRAAVREYIIDAVTQLCARVDTEARRDQREAECKAIGEKYQPR